MGFIAALLILLALAFVSYQSTRQLVDTEGWLAHTQEVLTRLNLLEADIVEAESAGRGYVITGDRRYLDDYQAEAESVKADVASVRQLTADNEAQQRRLDALAPMIGERLAVTGEIVGLRQGGRQEAAVQLVHEKGRLSSLILQRLEEMKSEERGLLTRRSQASEAATRRSTVILFVGTAVSCALLVGVFYLLNRKLATRRMVEAERERFFAVSLDMLCIAGFDGYFKRLNKAWEKALGITRDELMSKPYIEFIHPDDRERTAAESSSLLTGASTISFENRYLCQDGSSKWLHWNAVPDPRKEIVYAVARDITVRREMEEGLRSLALTDELTGLLNRRGFIALAEQQLKLARSKRSDKGLLLVYLDVDGLKLINDSFGHSEGSRTIEAAANVLRKSFRGSDVIARMGGDEFAVLAVDASGADTEALTLRIRKHLDDYNAQSDRGYQLALSLGVTLIDLGSTESLDELLDRTDRAMYEQKRGKRSQFSHSLSPGMVEQAGPGRRDVSRG
jgi:diguanylate cyclase (GGDEF)-like protein/PAS domain S-box-containing protein